MSFIGEAVLSVSVELLIKKLASEGLELFRRHEKLKASLMMWMGMLDIIQTVLADADDRQTKADKPVKKWLHNLQNLAYDVEDLLDEFETEALRRELLLQEPATCWMSSKLTSTSKFRKIIPTCCTKFSPRSIQFDSMMASKMEEITALLQVIERQKGLLKLKNVISDGRSRNVGQRSPTTSLVNEAQVRGRENDKKEIVELLLRDDLRANDGFAVISINGMGGVGKTTLAQLVYNDDRVKRHFEIKAWTCVSEDFDVFRVSKSILNSIASDQCSDKDDLNVLQEKLKKQLSGKKFLLILDDVWNQNYDSWSLLSRPFGAGASGSKIVVTTRNQGVAETMGAVSAKTLEVLSDDDCLRVLIQHSLVDFNMNQSLKEVGEKIAKKCKGLPLAAKTLGGLLRGRDDLNDWEFVLDTDIWNLHEENCNIIPALRVSYHFLPPQLKQCFAYCSLFPKDYEYQEEEMILLWTAEGFLDQEYNGRKMEDLGREFVRELHSRSLSQQSSRDASRFVMHDLINDLAQWAAGEIYFRMEDTLKGENGRNFSKSLRHFSYVRRRLEGEKRLKSICDVEHLRTFLPVKLSDYGGGYLAWTVLQMLLNLPRLRVFSLCGYYNISELPNEIGNLKHLRFLNLSGTEIEILPDSINSLYNLHTILLEDCRRLKKMCDMGNLKKLHHLGNSNVPSLEEMPKGLDKLTCLLTLCSFVVGKNSGCRLRKLKALTHLQGTLHILKLENVKDVGDASEAQLNSKVNLKALLLKWTISDATEVETDAAEDETRVLDMLKPHQKLEELTIAGYGGTKFPTWLGDSSFSKLVLLRFEGCCKCTSLPSVGQLPLLKHLKIIRMNRVKSVGLEFYPSLETLCFENMPAWEEWIPRGADREVEEFPKLRMLSLVRCSKLQGSLPERLPLLEKLVIESCERFLVTIHCLPSLSEMRIWRCNSLVSFPRATLPSQLRTVEIYDCNALVPLPEAWMGNSDSSLQSLEIRGCSSLVSFPEAALPSQLRTVTVAGCDSLKSLPEAWMGNSDSSLQSLEIRDCNSLVSFPEAALPSQLRTIVIEKCNALASLPEAWMGNSDSSLQSLEIRHCNSLVSFPEAALPSQLRTIKVARCDSLKSLPEAWMGESGSSLQSLEIERCNSLVSFPEATLPSQLREIVIAECNALESLPEAWMQNSSTSLESLDIAECHSLSYIAGIHLPPRLKRLIIEDCGNLRTLTGEQDIRGSSSGSTSPTSFSSENKLPATLEYLKVNRCSNLALLSRNGNLPPALKFLEARHCSKLESLAERLDNTSLEEISIGWLENLKSLPAGLHNLHRLQKIQIFSCPKLESFPEEGLPSTKLTYLSISWCENLKALPNGMHNLTSLQSLQICDCPSLVSLPEDGFPTNLQSLWAFDLKISKPLFEWGLNRCTSLRELAIRGGCPDLESSLQFPTSLSKLWISDMPNLKRLSSIGQNLTSLEFLDLHKCPKLKYFSKQGLPKSLLSLDIKDCPLIEKRCRKGKGKYWPMIAHIPCVEIYYV